MAIELIDAVELAERLRVRPSTVRAWRREGRIPAVRLTPKVVRFDFALVIEALTRAEQPRHAVAR